MKATLFMKSLLILAMISFFLKANATNFYVDASTVLTTQNGTLSNPWKTLSQVNGNMGLFKPGDIISFKRGALYNGQLNVACSGSSSSPIVFNAYGTGNAPAFIGTGNSIVYLFYVLNRSYVTFDGLDITDPTLSPTDRSQQSKIERVFYIDGSSNNIVVKNCSISLSGVGFYLVGPNNTIDHCSISNMRMVVNTNNGGYDDYGANGFVISSANNVITNNTISDCWANSYDFTYDGGAVEFFGPNTNNNFIGYNTMMNNNGLTEFGSNGGGTSTGNRFVYNKLINNNGLFYINNSGPFAITVSNLQYYNNVIVETSMPRLAESHMASMASASSNAGIVSLKNNIFWLTTGIDVARYGQFTGAQLVHDNNIYKLGTGSVLNFTQNNTEMLANTVAIFTNTQATDPVQWNFLPTSTSPAIRFGQNLGLSKDFAGNTVNTAPNAGILETTSVASLNVVATVGSIQCNGDSTTVVITASGGQPPYNGTGTFRVVAGNYTFTVTDASGTSQSVVSQVTQPAIILVSLSAGVIQQYGGTTSVTVTATGGTGAYLYQLDNGSFQSSNVFNGVSAGGHTVSVKDLNGCVQSRTIELTQPAIVQEPLVIHTISGTIHCYGDSTTVSIDATGGTKPYTGTGTFTVAAGVHSFTVSDATGQSQSVSITINQPTALQVDVIQSNPNGSHGGSATITVLASGGSGPYVYQLDAGTVQTSAVFKSVKPGSHTILVTDAIGCNKIIAFTIKKKKKSFSIAVQSKQDVSCKGAADGKIVLTATDAVSPVVYRVMGKDNRYENIISKLSAGTYTIIGTDAAQASDTISVVIENSSIACEGLNEINQLNIRIYPNPSASSFQVEANSPSNENISIQIIDMNGNRIIQSQMKAGQILTIGSNLRPGSYFMKAIQGSQITSKQLIKL